MLNIEDLKELVSNADSDTLIKITRGLSEEDRHKLADEAYKIYNEISEFRIQIMQGKKTKPPLPITFCQSLKKLFQGKKIPSYFDQQNTAFVATLIFCPLSTLKKIKLFFVQENIRKYTLEVLLDRKPEWIDEWVENKLQGKDIQLRWEILRPLIKANICSKPKSDNYIVLMLRDLYTFYKKGQKEERYIPISTKILKDPELLEDEIYRIFEVDSYFLDPHLDSRYNQLPDYHEDWITAILKLLNKGHLDRERLLDSCLTGINSNFKNNCLTNLINFFETLNPEPIEIIARQEKIIELMSSNKTHVVSFAIKQIRTIEKAKKLNDRLFIDSIDTVFNLSTKKQPLSTLSILRSIIKKDDKLAPFAIQKVAYGLTHTNKDVQELSLTILENYQKHIDDNCISTIKQNLNTVTDSLKQRCIDLIK